MIKPRFALAAALFAPAVVLLGGCSTGAADSAPKTAENFIHALADRDAEATCLMMAGLEDDSDPPITKKSPHWQMCLGLMNTALAQEEDIAKYSEAKVQSADLDGEEATVDEENITGVVEPDISLDLSLVDGKWYVVDFDW